MYLLFFKNTHLCGIRRRIRSDGPASSEIPGDGQVTSRPLTFIVSLQRVTDEGSLPIVVIIKTWDGFKLNSIITSLFENVCGKFHNNDGRKFDR